MKVEEEFCIKSGEIEYESREESLGITDEDLQELIDKTPASDPVALYFNDIKMAGGERVLTSGEVVSLAGKIERGVEAKKKLSSPNSLPGKEKEILQIEIDEATDAKDTLTVHNLRLAISVAKKYTGRGLPLLDLIQEGNIGILEAAEKFDPAKGFRFSTYATLWIKQKITRAIYNQGRSVRYTPHVEQSIRSLLIAQAKLQQLFLREPTTQELAESMGVYEEEVGNLFRLSKDPLRLNQTPRENGDETLQDTLPDDHSDNFIDETVDKITVEALLKEAHLDARTMNVLQRRSEGETLEDIGKALGGLTRERVRQIELGGHKIIRKILAKFEGNLQSEPDNV